MIRIGMLLFFSRNRAAHLFLEALFLWSLLPVQAASGSYDLARAEQREFYTQGVACALPIIVDHRGKHSADQQVNAFTRTPRDAYAAFERTVTAERETVVRAIVPLPARVIDTQHTSSDL